MIQTQVQPSIEALQEPDDLLVARARERQRGGATLLYAKYVRLVQSTLRRFVQDRALVEDLTQETFWRAFTAIGKLHDVSRLKGWLASIARRASLDHRDRQSLRVPEVPSSGVEPDEMDSVISSDGDIESRLRCSDVKRELARIPAPYRDALLMRYFDELPAPEIARRLAIGEPLVKYRIRRGLELLRSQWSAGHE